jgi:hypothetical protein
MLAVEFERSEFQALDFKGFFESKVDGLPVSPGAVGKSFPFLAISMDKRRPHPSGDSSSPNPIPRVASR